MSELEGLDGTVNVYVNGKEVEVFMGARGERCTHDL